MTKKIEKKNKKVSLAPQANPMRKFYELLWLMSLQDVDYYEVDLDLEENNFKPKLNNKIADFIKLRANEDLIKPHCNLLMDLMESKYIPKNMNISEYFNSKSIFDIASETWVQERIEIFTLSGMPPDVIYTELKRLTGEEVYTLEEIRAYIYFFWNFSYEEGWKDEFREPFCEYLKSDKLLSEFYSSSIKLLSGEVEPYDLLINLGFTDENGHLRRGILQKAQRRIVSNMLKATEDQNAAETILWERSMLLMGKLIDLKYSGNDGFIIPTYKKFNDRAKSSKNIILKKRKKIER